MKRGRRIHGTNVSLVYVAASSSISRFRFIVSTRVDKTAVTRNRVRRLLSESVNRIISMISPPLDGVMIANKGIVGLSQSAVDQLVSGILEKFLPKEV